MKSYTIPRPDNFDITKIFDCGQCFRFLPYNSDNSCFEGIALNRYLKITQNESSVMFEGTDEKEFNRIWKQYFALDIDYKSIQSYILSTRPNDVVLQEAIKHGSGIRLLKQDKWEALCSFIISQNNNIPRIRSLIEALSKKYGNKIIIKGKKYYSFPSAKTIAAADESELRELKVGFRAPYILDAAKKVATAELDLERLDELATDDLLNKLMTIKGVGRNF